MTKKKQLRLKQEAERKALLDDIERTKQAHATTLAHLESTTDPDLIDAYIYELNAVQVRYKFLLKRAKEQNLINMPKAI
ncbi:MAG: YaaL family protein [Lachnospiraceae bacterium]|nr:YaaL family protein [Lachnospiraceae bacterium]